MRDGIWGYWLASSTFKVKWNDNKEVNFYDTTLHKLEIQLSEFKSLFFHLLVIPEFPDLNGVIPYILKLLRELIKRMPMKNIKVQHTVNNINITLLIIVRCTVIKLNKVCN
jgi:hypothetical protein